MSSYTVTSKEQITLRTDVLAHLGMRPGDKLESDLLTDRRMQLKSKWRTSAVAVFGMLAKPQASFSVEEMKEIAASGWTDQRRVRCLEVLSEQGFAEV